MTDRTDDGDDASARDGGSRSAIRVATEGESWTGPSDRSLEPGSPSLEHALFVALGVAATLLVLGQFLL